MWQLVEAPRYKPESSVTDSVTGILQSKGQDLKMGPIGCPETSVRNYRYLLRNSPEECSTHLLRGGSRKSPSVCLHLYGKTRGRKIEKMKGRDNLRNFGTSEDDAKVSSTCADYRQIL